MSDNQQEEACRVFEATLRTAKALINRGCPPASIIAGLLGVVAAIGGDAAGPEETARMLRLVAVELQQYGLDS